MSIKDIHDSFAFDEFVEIVEAHLSPEFKLDSEKGYQVVYKAPNKIVSLTMNTITNNYEIWFAHKLRKIGKQLVAEKETEFSIQSPYIEDIIDIIKKINKL